MNFAQSKFYKPALVVLALTLLVGVSFVQRQMNQAREVMGLTRVEPLENAPPVLAFTTVALGSFRGLIANVLWVRATELQDQDKFFEMVQLADWITKLQPHFVTVWVHQAWNMAYNISVKLDDAEDRWLWVKRGIELLRDDGLKYNPTEPLIYRELAWFFQHKMGQNLDDAHNHYKEVWAKQMDDLFDDGRPNFEALINPTTDEARETARILRERYKMDPEFMQKVDQEYGPLEWRLPETHAIYWAALGLEKTSANEMRQNDLVQLRRVIFQSMQLAFHRGRLFYVSEDGDEFYYGPNLEIVDQANQAYLDMMEQEERLRENLANGHKNFLRTAVYFLYTHNRRAEAQKWFKYLKKEYPKALLTPEQLAHAEGHPHEPIPDKDLDTYALERVAEDISETSHDRVKTILLGLLTQSFVSLALGNNDEAVGYSRFAERVRNRYEQALGGAKGTEERVGMTSLAQLKIEVLNQLLDSDAGLRPELALRLRSELGLPATGPLPFGASTNRPSTNALPAQPSSASSR